MRPVLGRARRWGRELVRASRGKVQELDRSRSSDEECEGGGMKIFGTFETFETCGKGAWAWAWAVSQTWYQAETRMICYRTKTSMISGLI